MSKKDVVVCCECGHINKISEMCSYAGKENKECTMCGKETFWIKNPGVIV